MRVFSYDSTDSTNERALQAIASGEARHFDVHVARAQTAGRGRRGNVWHSELDQGVYLSVVLLPRGESWAPAALTIAAGLAVFECVREWGASGARLKWPNDLLVDGAKLAGILVESRGLDAQRPHYVVGVGLNLRQREFPRELSATRAVTSLALLGLDVAPQLARERLVERLRFQLERAAAPARALLEDYLDATALRDAEVVVESHLAPRHGRLVGLSFERGVELALANGRVEQLALEHVHQVRAR